MPTILRLMSRRGQYLVVRVISWLKGAILRLVPAQMSRSHASKSPYNKTEVSRILLIYRRIDEELTELSKKAAGSPSPKKTMLVCGKSSVS